MRDAASQREPATVLENTCSFCDICCARLFMEILNDCSDADEIKFQEDGTWCPMRPKKEALKVSSQFCPKIESKKRGLLCCTAQI